MKAILLNTPGGPENFEYHDIDPPTINSNEVLVRVKAIGINPVDMKTRTGKALWGQLKEDQPVILGWDISGEVVAAGSEVSQLMPGTEVFGMVNFPGHGKAYAEYVAAPEEHLTVKPASLSHVQAAAGTLAALTAWQVLVHVAEIKPGQRVLIHAAGGGVGHFAVQIAKHFGAYVIGTASAEKGDFLKSLGIDEHIDYQKGPFEASVKDVDIVLDPIGGQTTVRSMEVLKKGGRLVSIVSGVKDEAEKLATEKGIEAQNYLVKSSGADMEQLALLFDSGELKAEVSHTFTFDEIVKAHQQIDSGKTRGKVVVTL
jgi:NADPH:quinone reductase-like Zn-dependent oxidoreductase